MNFKFKRLLVYFLTLFALAGTLFASFSVDTTVPSGLFDVEIAPNDDFRIRNESERIEWIHSGDWVGYSNFNFGAETTYFTIEASSPTSNGTIQVWLDSLSGTQICTVDVPYTGGWQTYVNCDAHLPEPISGVHDVYFKFFGSGGTIMNTRDFSFMSIAPGTKQFNSVINPANFDLESNPGEDVIQPVSSGTALGYISDQSWVAFTNFNFGVEANHITAKAGTPVNGGQVELRIDSITGPVVGVIDVYYTGSWDHYKPFECTFLQSVSGTHDLYLKFIDSNGVSSYLFNLQELFVDREVPAPMMPIDATADEDLDDVPDLLEYATGMNPQSSDTLPFAFGVTNNGAYSVQLRVRDNKNFRTKLLVTDNLTADSWQEITLIYTNDTWQTDSTEVAVSEAVSIGDDLYTVHLENNTSSQSLFVRLAADLPEGKLHVYDPVPGGADLTSPYYSFRAQKVSALDSTNLTEVTNWEEPFAFFTKCVDRIEGVTNAYYEEYIGSWSHTYCNVELDPNTPIVVKIHRYTQAELTARGITTEAPLGPITQANPYPARKVDSCEIIGGDVYVTMSQPALVAIDIDGQMDNRDVPRNDRRWWIWSFGVNNEADASHSVSIFANPFIENKPVLGGDGVYAVEPGILPPETGDWTTLYFKPGVHNLSVDANGDEREWIEDDVLILQNDKSYYIPGDAIVFGNMNDFVDDAVSENIHIFGHGTLNGSKIAHFSDYKDGPPPTDNEYLHSIGIRTAQNCVLEGITVADPPEHGITFRNASATAPPNYVKWLKNINWRQNNDAVGMGGNCILQDSFFRHQDDGVYVGGLGTRRCVFWTDVNGIPFRTSFITRQDGNMYNYLPNLIFEDCDIIYARGVFNAADYGEDGDAAIIGANGAGENNTYSDGTVDTGQYLIFRNIRCSDPRPQKNLLGFSVSKDLAGIRFENCVQEYPSTWGWIDDLHVTTNTATISNLTFDNCYIAGEKIDAAWMNNPDKIETTGVDVSSFNFR